MKLVEILARKLNKWPDGVACYTQDKWDGYYTAWPTDNVSCEAGNWFSGEDSVSLLEFKPLSHLAEDCTTAIVTKDMWQAEKDKPLSSNKEEKWIPQVGDRVMYKNTDSLDYAWDKPEEMEVISIHEGMYGLLGGCGYIWSALRHLTPIPKAPTPYEEFEEDMLDILLDGWQTSPSRAKALCEVLYEKGLRFTNTEKSV